MTSLQNNITIVQDSLDNIKDAIISKGGVITDITSYATGILNIPELVGFNREVSPQGVFQFPSQNFIFSLPENAIDVGDSVMFSAFYGCTSLTSADLSSLTTISGNEALYYAFYKCTSLTSVDLSSLTTVSGYRSLADTFSYCTSLTSVDLSSLTSASNISLYYTFRNCTSLTSVDLSSLTTISGSSSSLFGTFHNCTSLTSVDLSSLTTVSGYRALNSTFYNCTSLTSINLSSLSVLSGSNALRNTFQLCTSLSSLSFPSLNSNSFGTNTNQFNNMLAGVTGCAVHFPSNLQTVIGGWSDVVAGFGGTNTTVLFDLPATT